MRIIAIVIVWLLSPPVFGDGMPIINGRFAEGAVSELKLSPWQVLLLRVGGASVLELSEAQRNQLRAESGSGPARLYIYNTRLGENDCTCEAVNRGLWFSEWRMEIPHAYLDETQEMPSPEGVLQCWLVSAGGACIAIFIPVGFWRRRSWRIKASKMLTDNEQGADGKPPEAPQPLR